VFPINEEFDEEDATANEIFSSIITNKEDINNRDNKNQILNGSKKQLTTNTNTAAKFYKYDSYNLTLIFFSLIKLIILFYFLILRTKKLFLIIYQIILIKLNKA